MENKKFKPGDTVIIRNEMTPFTNQTGIVVVCGKFAASVQMDFGSLHVFKLDNIEKA